MKSMIYTQYGSPDVLQYKEVDKPVPADDELLIQVHAASVNYGDMILVSGKPYIARLMGYGLLKPKVPILGTDIAGLVEAVGKNVTQFQPGDAVFGDISACGFGAFAEYATATEQAVVLKPANVRFEQAAAVPQAAVVALQGLRTKGHIQPGQKVLVIGASGGVGTFAIQIAKSFGTEVTGVCSTGNVDAVYAIGADDVIDHTQEDFATNGRQYDLIFDIVANRPIADYLHALTPTGSYVACAFNPIALLFGRFITMKTDQRVTALSHKPNQADLMFVQRLLEEGKVFPVIDRCYPLDELAAAMRYLKQGRHRGKIVITVVSA
ncbi:MAG: NAD(P)-dependent alcohol dehydrogenase [Anaerolineae bacterium]|nr:NAD(P)-dependent alcohol dehydrogenase [Anaerolineae bacterium]